MDESEEEGRLVELCVIAKVDSDVIDAEEEVDV